MKTSFLRFTLIVSILAGPSMGRPPAVQAADQTAFAGTEPLTMTGDIASTLVDGADRFLLRKLGESFGRRERHWHRDFSSPQAYTASLEPQRRRLLHILGVRDERVPFTGMEYLATTERSAHVGQGASFDAYLVRWPAVGDMHGEGLLLVPREGKPMADVVVIPDADQAPEALAGLVEGIPTSSQLGRLLAEQGCRVVIPMLVDRTMEKRNGRANLSSREFLYRSAFELGRHLIGYEVQKVLAVVDWFGREAGNADVRVGVFGYGEGGMLALYAGALDPRIDAVAVSGFFDSRRRLWEEPIDRNVFGLLDWFGNAELASMVVPRPLVIEAARGPEVTLPGQGGAPARLITPPLADVRAEVLRARELVRALPGGDNPTLVVSGEGQGPFASDQAVSGFLHALGLKPSSRKNHSSARSLVQDWNERARRQRQMHEIDRHNQWLLRESPYVRAEFMKNLDTSSLTNYEQSVATYRTVFYDDVLGRFEDEVLPFHARSRPAYDAEKWTGYEVVLDVFPDVIAYGVLLWPKNMRPGEKRPVVVCQHGLEGRPQDIISGDHSAYHDFAARLAERGFITFAPQNLYIFTDRFRTLQRKANLLGKTLFSIITPQHQQIVNWLKTLPNVDGSRIAFYGLSYGGKTSMRVPALVTDYCLSICSADFNEWVWKNASTRSPYSYVWTGEYEIFEFDLGSTFNYAEMAALIAPRPFMVERGHFDGVAPDEAVAYEFAKVRFLYEARLKLPDRCELEFFVGPHTINGQGTFRFLHRHLNWPEP